MYGPPSSEEAWRTIRQSFAQDNNIGEFMLRFRPIAPKPATCPGDRPREISACCSEGRRKRKYVRVRRNSRYTRRNDKKPRNDAVSDALLPESRSSDSNRRIESGDQISTAVVVSVAVMSVQARATAENDQWVATLESDTCPGFVSDGSDNVTWVNGAFKKMVAASESKVVVGLVIKERFPSFYSSLTGHVKLQYYNSHALGGKLHSRVVPLDLWRMDGGGFAWRLDVDAALTLGRT